MPKSVWITALDREKDAPAAARLQQTLGQYGLGVQGHFFEDNLQEVAWTAARTELLKPEIGAWVLLGGQPSFATPSVRYGLALLALGVQAKRGHGFPIFLLPSTGELSPASLPTPFQGAEVAVEQGLGVKLTAKANLPVPKVPSEYRLDVHGLPAFGEWFEVGPAAGRSWKGALFGVSEGGTIAAHGVGPAGKPPERATLHYPMQGVELALGGEKFVAWAVQNDLGLDASYYLSVKGHPARIVFGPYPEGDAAEMYAVRLK